MKKLKSNQIKREKNLINKYFTTSEMKFPTIRFGCRMTKKKLNEINRDIYTFGKKEGKKGGISVVYSDMIWAFYM